MLLATNRTNKTAWNNLRTIYSVDRPWKRPKKLIWKEYKSRRIKRKSFVESNAKVNSSERSKGKRVRLRKSKRTTNNLLDRRTSWFSKKNSAKRTMRMMSLKMTFSTNHSNHSISTNSSRIWQVWSLSMVRERSFKDNSTSYQSAMATSLCRKRWPTLSISSQTSANSKTIKNLNLMRAKTNSSRSSLLVSFQNVAIKSAKKWYRRFSMQVVHWLAWSAQVRLIMRSIGLQAFFRLQLPRTTFLTLEMLALLPPRLWLMTLLTWRVLNQR